MTSLPGRPVDVTYILSSCVFFVRNVPVSKQEKETLLWMDKFKKHCEEKHKSLNKSLLDLEQDDFVAVLSKDGKRWDRGQVKSYYQTASKFLYKVFLIDRGQEVQVESINLVSLGLNENFCSKPRQAYQIGIYGIFTTSKENGHRCQKECRCTTTEYVRNLLKTYAINFDRVIEIGGIAFGHIYLDCDHEGVVNLADKLCEEGLAVRPKRFTKDVPRHYFQNCGTENGDASLKLSPTPEAITNEATSRRKSTSSLDLMHRKSSEDSFSEDSFPSSDEVNNDTAFMKQYINRNVRYVPAGMPVDNPKARSNSTKQRLSKMNGMMNRMKESNYSGRLTNTSNNRNNFKVVQTKGCHNTLNNQTRLKDEFTFKSKESNGNITTNKVDESTNSHCNGELSAGSTLNESFKSDSLKTNTDHTSNNKTNPKIDVDVKACLPTQHSMAKLIDKIKNNKHKTKTEEVVDAAKSRTNIDHTVSGQNFVILQQIADCKSVGSTSNQSLVLNDMQSSVLENQCAKDLLIDKKSNCIENKIEAICDQNFKFVDEEKCLVSNKKTDTVNPELNNANFKEEVLLEKDKNIPDFQQKESPVVGMQSSPILDEVRALKCCLTTNHISPERATGSLTAESVSNVVDVNVLRTVISPYLMGSAKKDIKQCYYTTLVKNEIDPPKEPTIISDPLSTNTTRVGELVEPVELNEENISIGDDSTDKLKSVEEGKIIDKTVEGIGKAQEENSEEGDPSLDNINSNTGKKLESNSPAVKNSKQLSLVERIRLLEELSSRASLRSPNTSINNCSLETNTSSCKDSEDSFNHSTTSRFSLSSLNTSTNNCSRETTISSCKDSEDSFNQSSTSRVSLSSQNRSINNCSMETNTSSCKVSEDYINQSVTSVGYQSDSHISFKSRKSLDLNYSALTLNSSRGSEVSFEHRNSNQGYFEHVRNGSVLIHGKRAYKPVQTFYDADLDEVISRNLDNCGLRDLTRLHKYAFPVLMDRQNTVMVSSRLHFSGKPLAYIVPLLSLLRQHDYYKEIPDGNGPLAVIIVSGWNSVQNILDMCNKLLKTTCDVNVQVAYVGEDEITMKTSLTNGCDLLISTPRCFLRLLKEKYVTNINRMCHLVLDETEVLFTTFVPEIQELVGLVKKMLAVRESSGVKIQLQTIVLSDKWTPTLEDLVLTVLHEPVVCIASPLEAAVYSKVKPVAVFLRPEVKITKLFELLKTKTRQQKTLVVCSLQEEVEEIGNAAELRGVDVITIHQGMPHIHCADLLQLWSSKPVNHETILVCTDDVLGELAISDAQNLIHFSLPEKKTGFSLRFGCLLNAFRDIFNPDDQKSCQVYIFVDENNEIQLPELMWFLHRMGIKVPPSLEATVAKILESREINKKDVFFCENLKQFGRCLDKHKCKSRHILKKEEDSCQEDVPQSGEIKITILNIHNAGHYSVRILEHFDGEVWNKMEQFYLQIAMEINNYYNNEETRRLHGYPSVGDVAGFETSSNCYQRVEVLTITKYDEHDKPSTVLIKLIDQGFIIQCQVMELYVLPDKLKEYPAQAVDVYLCRMLPVDLDRTWNDAIKNTVALWISQMSEEHVNSYFVGKIVLSLGRDIWLDPLECAEWLPLCNTSVEYMCMRKRLLENNFAVDNPEHLKALYKLCDNAGISYLSRKSESTVNTISRPIKPQWAHLSRDEYTSVNVIEISTLDKIFLRNVAFQDRLQILMKDINDDIKNNNNKGSVAPGSLNVGDYCLGRFSTDGIWYRAMVMNKSENELQLFYVDHGDIEHASWDDVKKISPEFVARLPFQTIECYLAGVEPLHGDDWGEEATDFLYDKTEIDNVIKNIFVKVCEINLQAKLTGGRRYKVILIDTTGTSDVIINQELVLRGFAKYKSEEKHLLENVFANDEIPKKLDDVEVINNNTNGGNKCNSGTNQTEDVNHEIVSYSENNRTNNVLIEEEEEDYDEKVIRLLEELANEDFEYVGSNINFENEERHVKLNNNTVVIKDLPDNKPTVTGTRIVSNTSKNVNTDVKPEKPLKELVDLPELVNHGRCPNIVWHQNEHYVWIRVYITDVQNYRLVWKVRELHFSTIHQNEFYCLNLDLFGGMEPEHLYHHSDNGFYLEIKLKKVVKGLPWPRLTYEKIKYPWIKTNLEHYKESENMCVDELTDELKLYKNGKMLDDDDSSTYTASSEIYEPDAVPYDPYDPFG